MKHIIYKLILVNKIVAIATALIFSFSNSFAFANDNLRAMAADERIKEEQRQKVLSLLGRSDNLQLYRQNRPRIMELSCDVLGIRSPEEFRPIRPVRGLILAAGKGARLQESGYTGPKALYPINGRPMIFYVLDHISRFDKKPLVVVSEDNKGEIENALSGAGYDAEYVIQDMSPDVITGTGAAVLAAREALKDFDGDLIINWADNIVRRPETMSDALLIHEATGSNFTLPTTFLEEPETNTIQRDAESGRPIGSNQALDGKLVPGEVDIGLFLGRARDVLGSLGAMTRDEKYLTRGASGRMELGFPKIMEHMREGNLTACAVHCADPSEAGGINDVRQAAVVSQRLNELNLADPRPTQNRLLHSNWVRYFMTLNRRFCPPAAQGQKRVMFIPASGATVVEFLITNADVAIYADRNFIGDINELPTYLNRDLTQGSEYQTSYYNRAQIRSRVIREEYDNELLQQLIIGLRCIGAENIKIESSDEDPHLTMIRFGWAYWGEPSRERVIYLMHSKTEPSQRFQQRDFDFDAAKLEQYPQEVEHVMAQGIDYVIFKACGDLTHSKESRGLRAHAAEVLKPNGKIFTEGNPEKDIWGGLHAAVAEAFALYPKENDRELLTCEQVIRDMLGHLTPDGVAGGVVTGVWGYSQEGVTVWIKLTGGLAVPQRIEALQGMGVPSVGQQSALMAILRQASFGERRNITFGNDVTIGKDVTFIRDGSGTIEIHDGARIQDGVKLIAPDGQHIIIGAGTTILAGYDTVITGDIIIGKNCEISGRVTDAKVGDRTMLHNRPVVTMAEIGSGCHINGGEIKGYYAEGRGSETIFEEGKPINIVVVKDGARINRATIRTVKEKHSWRLVKKIDPEKKAETLGRFPLRNIAVDVKATIIEGIDPESNKQTLIEGTTITNAEIGGGTVVEPEAFVADASTGRRCRVASQARLELTALKDDIRFGAEASKSRLGRGTTAAHKSAYVSVVTHDAIPLLNEEGTVEILELGANCSGIPAQCTFANLTGESDENGEPIKGTAHLLGPSFIASGTVIVNLPGRPDISLEEIYEQDDMTVMGPFCYIVNRVKGAVLPFTKAGEKVEKVRRGKMDRVPDISPRFHDIGWVLDNYTGMILDKLLRLKKYANPQVFDSLVERTLVHSINLVKRELAKPESHYDKYKLMRGLEIYEAHLYSGAWKMKNGNFSWGGKLEKGEDFKALEREIKKKVRSYREQKRQERFKPIQTWIDIFRNKSNPQLEKTLIEIYGERPDFIETRRAMFLKALEEAAKIFGFNREVCIVRSPARINLCGRGNQDAEDGHMNYLSEGRENVMVVAQREGDTNVNLYNATPAFQNQRVSFSIAREVEHAQAAWHSGWADYINDEVIRQRVEAARKDKKVEWINVARGSMLNLIHGLGDLGLFYLNVDINGFDALVYSDIPPGGGISSSSAFAVSSALSFLNTNRLGAVPREAIAMLPYEIYTGELGGNGDHAAIILAQLNKVTHLSQMNSTGRSNADYIDLSDDLQIAIVPSFVSSRKTGEQMIENNKAKFSFKLAVPIIIEILRELQPQYPTVITDDFINNFKYIGQLNKDSLGDKYEEIIYKILRRLPEGKTAEELMNEYPYPGHRSLAERFGLTEEEFKKFEEIHAVRDPSSGVRKVKQIERKVDLKGPVMFFLATAERARMFGEYLRAQEQARMAGRVEEREDLLDRIGEFMYINHDGDRVTTYDPGTGKSMDFQGRQVTNESLQALIADLNSGNPERVARARLCRQPGYFRASIPELDAIVDIAKGLGKDSVVGAVFGGAGYGGTAVVLLRKRTNVDTFKVLKQALEMAKVLQKSREDAIPTGEISETAEFATLNIPVAGASVFEISGNFAAKTDTLIFQNREILAGV